MQRGSKIGSLADRDRRGKNKERRQRESSGTLQITGHMQRGSKIGSLESETGEARIGKGDRVQFWPPFRSQATCREGARWGAWEP